MSKKTTKDQKRRQALNDATHGQFGSEPRPEVKPDVESEEQNRISKERRERANREKYYVK